MQTGLAISSEAVSKKFCRSTRRSMRYGLTDIARNVIGMHTSRQLRPDEFWAVRDAALRVKEGECVGLIGPNGSGKTTLLQLINGIFWPDAGEISVRGRVGALIAVGAGFHALLTGRENIHVSAAVMGMSRKEVNARFDSIVDFADIGDFLDTPVKHYSSGMYVRLGFAIAVHADPDVMLVDEVLAVGDHGFQSKCFKRMAELREQGTTVVLVSHDMHTVAGFADWVALVDHGQVTRYDNVSQGVRAYARLFVSGEDEPVQELVTEGRYVRFHDVRLGERRLAPGDSFRFGLPFECTRDYEDVEVEVSVHDERDPEPFVHVTNRAYRRRVDLRGRGQLDVEVGRLDLQASMAVISIAVWNRQRDEQLFWWRVPVEFAAATQASGRCFVPVTFDVS